MTLTHIKAAAGMAALALTASVPLVHAAEAIAYKYDAKGRLVQVKRTDTVNNNVTTDYTHDKANNRTKAKTTGSTNTPLEPSIPTPTPTNQPPIANADSGGTMLRCSLKTINVTANDTDPESNYPLQVVSVSSPQIGATVVSATSIQFESEYYSGIMSATYVVRDSLGATSTGTVSITVSGKFCQ